MQTAQPLPPSPLREARIDDSPEVFTQIYDPACNLAVWQRTLPGAVHDYLSRCLSDERRIHLKTLFTCQPEMHLQVRDSLEQTLPQGEGRQALIDDIVQLMEMYACLFEPRLIGIRLATLQQAMCPRFHVDYLPARLVTTYFGAGTQWLSEPTTGEARIPAQEPTHFEQLNTGDVALLKGDGWFENEGLGIVHRSPAVAAGSSSLFLSLDWAD